MTLQTDLPLSFTPADFLALHGLGLGSTAALAVLAAIIGAAILANYASPRI